MKTSTPIKTAAVVALSLACLGAFSATMVNKHHTHAFAAPVAMNAVETAPAIAQLAAEPALQTVTITARRPLTTIVVTAKRLNQAEKDALPQG